MNIIKLFFQDAAAARLIITNGNAALLKIAEGQTLSSGFTGSRRRSRAASDVPTSCAEFISKIDDLTTAANNRDMTEILAVATALASTSASVTCTVQEKTTLVAKEADINAVVIIVNAMILEGQQLLGITKTTTSTSKITTNTSGTIGTTTSTTTTTTASTTTTSTTTSTKTMYNQLCI